MNIQDYNTSAIAREVQEGTSASFGRNWLMDIKVDWKNLPGLNHVDCMFPSAYPCQGNAALDSVLRQHDKIISAKLGCYTGEPVVLIECKGAKFHKLELSLMLCNRKWRAPCRKWKTMV